MFAPASVMDKKAEKYYNTTPYAYALNNPIVFVDPDGEDTYLVIYGSGQVSPMTNQSNVGDGFQKNAEALAENIRNSGILGDGDAVVVLYTATESEYIDAINTEYESGAIAQMDVFSHSSNNSVNLGGPEGATSEEGKDYRNVSAYGSADANPDNNKELKQINADNFTKDATVTLWGCYLGGATNDPNEKSHAQALANHLGENRTVKAFKGSGAEFKQDKNGNNVYNGTMIKSTDRYTQEVNLNTFKKREDERY